MTFTVNTADWPEQRAALIERINEHHAALERAQTWEAACFLQGQIASLRWLIEQGDPNERIGGTGHAKY